VLGSTVLLLCACSPQAATPPVTAADTGAISNAAPLLLDPSEYFTRQGLDVLVFNNSYDGNFSDSKIAGIELIHHGVRTVTNGDVRLSPTPEQWDPVATLESRQVLQNPARIETRLSYPSPKFSYTIQAEPQGSEVLLRVVLDQPLPPELEGKAGFNLEFLPAAYFGKSYLVDQQSGLLPLYPSGPTAKGADGKPARLPIAQGSRLVLGAEDPERRVQIESPGATLELLDGRNQAQNGWFVVRSLLPSAKTGTVLE
jgi:endoglucanase